MFEAANPGQQNVPNGNSTVKIKSEVRSQDYQSFPRRIAHDIPTPRHQKQRLYAHVVEDCVSTCLLHCHYLQDLGFITTSSFCVESAVEKCKKTRFDLILMDISLPGYERPGCHRIDASRR